MHTHSAGEPTVHGRAMIWFHVRPLWCWDTTWPNYNGPKLAHRQESVKENVCFCLVPIRCSFLFQLRTGSTFFFLDQHYVLSLSFTHDGARPRAHHSHFWWRLEYFSVYLLRTTVHSSICIIYTVLCFVNKSHGSDVFPEWQDRFLRSPRIKPMLIQYSYFLGSRKCS